MRKLIILVLLFLGGLQSLKATHLTHGSLHYEYLGEDSAGNWKYKITMTLYRDCWSSQVEFDNEIAIGVYNGQSPWQRVERYDIKIKYEADALQLSIGDVGIFENRLCHKKGVYEQIVSLPKSQAGYYVVWNRCCKTNSNNLINDMGSNYTVFIPSEPNTLAKPYFGGIVTASQNVLTRLGVGYYDDDGDSLSYEFTGLLSGSVSDMSPIWQPTGVITFPITKVSYRNGYSAQMPLGQFSSSDVSSQQGVLRFFINNQGLYYVGVKVLEWRDGILLTEQIKELHLLVLNDSIPTTEVYLNAESGELKKQIPLNWGMTLVALDADSFEIERRVKGTQSWNKLTTVLPKDFSYLDTAVNYNIMYEYRVTAQLDNGGFKVSNIGEAIVLSWNPATTSKILETNSLTVFPNPASSSIYIAPNINEDIKEVSIIDMRGKELLKVHALDLGKGIRVEPLAKGVYFVKLKSLSNTVRYVKFMKQ